MAVYLVVRDRASYEVRQKLFFDIAAYIDENYVESRPAGRFVGLGGDLAVRAKGGTRVSFDARPKAPGSALSQFDESLSGMLL